MDALEVRLDQDRLICFDGRVLEFFGAAPDKSTGTKPPRFHVKLLAVEVEDPDKKGIRTLSFRVPAYIAFLLCDEPAFERFQPMLDALRAAGVSVSP